VRLVRRRQQGGAVLVDVRLAVLALHLVLHHRLRLCGFRSF
jgi:hypothetical protein